MNTPTPVSDLIVKQFRAGEAHSDGLILTIGHLELKLAAMTAQRDEWKAKYIQQNKDLGYELRDPNGTIWSECKRLQSELTAATEQRDKAREELAGIENKMRFELGGHPDSELWGGAGLVAATMRCVDALGEVTDQLTTATEQRDEARGQRDRLAEALEQLMAYQPRSTVITTNERHVWSNAKDALQSLTQPTEP
jgi:uncharacterized coiled-coil DUF342 family protein